MLRNNPWYTFVEPFLSNRLSKGSLSKQKGVTIKSYDINSLLEGHCTFSTVISGENAFFALECVENCSWINKKSASSIAQFQNASIFIEKAVWSILNMFVLEILEDIVIHFFWHDKNFCIFSGRTLSVEVQTNCRWKLPKIIGDMFFYGQKKKKKKKNTIVFIAREIISTWNNFE